MQIAITTLVLIVSATASFGGPAVTQTLVDDIKSTIDEIGNTPSGCSDLLAHVDTLRAEHPQFHFYFAGRADDTHTGMRGYGYGFHTDDAVARNRAMGGCQRWETEFGTEGGTKTCTLRKWR